MQMVIKIPDGAIKTEVIENDIIAYFECCTPKLFKTLKSAVVLPKHHGRLIDADELKQELIDKEWITDYDGDGLENIVDEAPTIIEPDKESDNK